MVGLDRADFSLADFCEHLCIGGPFYISFYQASSHPLPVLSRFSMENFSRARRALKQLKEL